MGLPNGYTQLEWIKCTGTQWINTGISPKSEVVEYECMWLEETLYAGQTIFGSTNTGSSTAKWSATHYKSSTTAMYSATGITDRVAIIDGIAAGRTNVLKSVLNNGTITRTQNGKTLTATYSGSIQNATNIGIMADIRTSDVTEKCNQVRMYYWRMRDNGVLVRDMVPAKRNSDSAVGMFDLVNNVFYANAGTGTFTAGPVAEYTELEYIKSTGTQYIDTGYALISDHEKVEMKFLLERSGAWSAWFGGETTADGPWSITPLLNSSSALTFYVASSSSQGSIPMAANTTYDLKCELKNGTLTYSCGSTSGSVAVSGSLDKTKSIYVFTLHSADEANILGQAASYTLYSFKLYDNNTLVRDFIPARRNSDGAVGLLDQANNVFYGNAGTGTFTAGPEIVSVGSLANIDGTSVLLTGCIANVGGIEYAIPYALANVDGIEVVVPFGEQVSGTPVGDFAVGDTVWMNVNGTPYEWIVVHQGLPSSLYDSSCDGTWLLMKGIYESRKWNSSSANKYESSAIRTYLNSDFLNLFDADVLTLIKTVKIPYRAGGGSAGTTQQGTNGLSTQIFLLSGTEVGYTNSYLDSGEGAVLSYFNGCTATAADSKRIAYLDGTATNWWLRSPDISNSNRAWIVAANGNLASANGTTLHGVRPALVMQSDSLAGDDGFIILE